MQDEYLKLIGKWVRVDSFEEVVWEPVPLDYELMGGKKKLLYRGPLEGVVSESEINSQLQGDAAARITVTSRRTAEKYVLQYALIDFVIVDKSDLPTDTLWQGDWVDGVFVPDSDVR
jgi:hypothetical protein